MDRIRYKTKAIPSSGFFLCGSISGKVEELKPAFVQKRIEIQTNFDFLRFQLTVEVCDIHHRHLKYLWKVTIGFYKK